MPRIRVLIVDDSVVVRRLVSDLLASDPALEVAGTAPNGRIALDKLTQVNPDLVLLDVEMPEMDGLQTLAAIRKTHLRLPVVMFSQHTQRGAAATIEALSQGANDYVTKPDSLSGGGIEQVRDQLLAKIKGLVTSPAPASRPSGSGLPGIRPSSSGIPASRPSAAGTVMTRSPLERGMTPRVELMVVGVSTGGPNALAALLPVLPADFPVPLLIVQHMPPLFTRLLAQRLAGQCALCVTEASADDLVLPGHAYICPGDFHLEVVRAAGHFRLGLTQAPPENSCRPSVDVLFRSAVAACGGGVLGVVLTGMGQDGLKGSEYIRDAGGQVLVQDEASSVVWGMPGAVARAGLADRIVPLDQMATEMVVRGRRGRSLSSAGMQR